MRERGDAPAITEARHELAAALEFARDTSGGLAALRNAVAGLAAALTDTVATLGLPVIDTAAEAEWLLVVPVSEALRHADTVLAESSRSTRRLDGTRRELMSAAAALLDPARTASPYGHQARRNLPVVVPGPDGRLPDGVIDCEVEAGVRTVRWYPDGWTGAGELLSIAAGRHVDFRYRWADRRVWDQLALDLIIVCCGWRVAPAQLPPLLSNSRQLLGNQLRRDVVKGTWAVQSATIVAWLEQNNVVTTLSRDKRQPHPT